MKPGRQNTRIISTLVLVFVAGAAAGALVMQLGLHDKLHRVTAAATPPARELSRNAAIEKFRTQLALSDDQTAKVSLVLEDYRQYYQSLQDQLDDLRATGKNRIMQILSPEQRAKYDKLMLEIELPTR